MGIVLELIFWILIEIVFWGIMFWTGCAILSIVSFGKFETQDIRDDPKKLRRKPKFIAITLIGFLFWIAIWITLAISIL